MDVSELALSTKGNVVAHKIEQLSKRIEAIDSRQKQVDASKKDVSVLADLLMEMMVKSRGS